MYNERKTKGTSTLTGFMALSIIVQASGFYSLTSALNQMNEKDNMISKNSSITYTTENLSKTSKVNDNINNTYYAVPLEPPVELLDIPTCNTEFKTYMDYRTITDKTSAQYELQQSAWTDDDGFRRINDDYIVAMGTYYSETIGDRFKITFDTDNEITVTIGDIKQDIHTDYFRQYTPMYDENGIFFSGNVLEFVVDTKVLPDLPRRLGTVSSFKYLKGNIKSIKRIKTEE